MPRKKRPPITLLQKLQQLKANGMEPERSKGVIPRETPIDDSEKSYT